VERQGSIANQSIKIASMKGREAMNGRGLKQIVIAMALAFSLYLGGTAGTVTYAQEGTEGTEGGVGTEQIAPENQTSPEGVGGTAQISPDQQQQGPGFPWGLLGLLGLAGLLGLRGREERTVRTDTTATARR
jgi:hypothetical protein